jgi:hypothetical protein
VLLAGSQLNDGLTDLVVPAGFSFSVYGTTVAGGTTLRACEQRQPAVPQHVRARRTRRTPRFPRSARIGPEQVPGHRATLFLQWDDWRMTAPRAAALDAGIYTKLQGVAPNREWIIEWRGRVRGDGAVTTNNNRAAIVFHGRQQQLRLHLPADGHWRVGERRGIDDRRAKRLDRRDVHAVRASTTRAHAGHQAHRRDPARDLQLGLRRLRPSRRASRSCRAAPTPR